MGIEPMQKRLTGYRMTRKKDKQTPQNGDIGLDTNILPECHLLLYQTDDGRQRIEVRLEDETVWLSQVGMAELFQTTKQNISLHLKNIYEEGELPEAATVKEYLTVRTEGNRRVNREIAHYNLEAIIAVGYRVRSRQGTQFRKWATERLNEYLVKGFTMDDERLKEVSNIGSDYFDEMLERIKGVLLLGI